MKCHNRHALSMFQMMKVVIYCAVAFACVAPLLPAVHGREGVIALILFEAVAIPVVWAALSMVLVRRGDFRDRLVKILLLVSVCVALMFALYLLGAYTIPLYGDPLNEVGTMFLVVHILAILALAAAACFLASRLLKRRAARAASSVETPELVPERTP